MAPSLVRPRSRWLALLAAAALALLIAGCGSGGGSEEGSDTTAGSGEEATTTAADEATTTEAEEATTTEAEGGEGGGDLVGEWTADAADILFANTANLGGVEADCEGPVTLTFDDDGTFEQSSNATCTIAGVSGTASITSSGDYATDGGTLTVSNATSEGTMEMMGQTQPMPGAGMSDGSAEYSVDGDTLVLTFTEATVGEVTQTYTRA